MSEMGAFRSMVRDETLGIAIGVVFFLWFGRAIALKLALRVAYKKNKSALMVRATFRRAHTKSETTFVK